MSTLRQKQEYQAQVAEDKARERQQKDKKAEIWKGGWNSLATIPLDDERLYDDLGLPERTRDIPREELFTLCQTFKAELEQRGYKLLHAGKLEKFLSVHYERGKNLSLDIIRQCFERLVSLGAFNKGELDATNVKEPVPDTEQGPTLETLETLDLSTREGAARGRKLSQELAYSTEYRAMYKQWREHLYRDYQFIPTETDVKRVLDYVMARDPLRHETWNAARRMMVSQGYWPSTMLTPDEVAAKELETVNLSTLSFDEQSALKNKLHKIQEVHGRKVYTG